MQNEFEKQVQQKMGELDFVPSTPVWEKIEAQIRRKKDRRRLLLWLPLCCLLLGGGTWLLLHRNGTSEPLARVGEPAASQLPERSTVKTSDDTPSEENTESLTPSTAKTKSGTNEETPVEANSSPVIPSQQKSKQTTALRTANDLEHTAVVTNKSVRPTSVNKKDGKQDLAGRSTHSSTQKNKTTKEKDAVVKNATIIEPGLTASNPLPPADDVVATPVQPQKQKPVDSSALLKPDSAAMTLPVEKAKPVVKLKQRHWKLGITGGLGFSGSAEALQKGGGLLAYDYAVTAAPPPPPLLYNRHQAAAKPTKGLSFSLGLVAQRVLTKRIGFSTGLAYHYYSTRIPVGRSTAQYQNQGGTASPTIFDNDSGAANYHNGFHFIALPVALDWQVLRRRPLKLQAGIAVQQLVKTTALQFNSATQTYSLNPGAYNRTQVFSTLGLSYDLPLRGATLSLGPQLHYALSALEKNGGTNRLFSAGIGAKLLLGKK